MSIKDLLKRWSELEPDRCSHVAGIFALRGWSISFDSEVSDRLTTSEIQNAVQEAIENRSWNWMLGRIIIGENIYYKAKIAIPSLPEAVNRTLKPCLSTCSPAFALLQCYIEVLDLLFLVEDTETETATRSQVTADSA